MNKKDLLNAIRKHLFYSLDLNLYLDNFPNCKEARMDYCNISGTLDKLVKEYEEKYGPLINFGFARDEDAMKWTCEPWPWEKCD